MARLLFLDTETTAKDPYRARLTELAVIYRDTEDASQNEEWSLLVAGDQDIPPVVQQLTGITPALLAAEGRPLAEVLDKLTMVAIKARTNPSPYHYSPPNRLIAHNLRYDLTVLNSEYQRLQAKAFPLNFLTPFCTMTYLTDRMRIPGKFRNTYKWPTLKEAAAYCNVHADGPLHRAAADTQLCSRVYDYGCREGWWTHDRG